METHDGFAFESEHRGPDEPGSAYFTRDKKASDALFEKAANTRIIMATDDRSFGDALSRCSIFLQRYLSGERGFTRSDVLAGIARTRQECRALDEKYSRGEQAKMALLLIEEGKRRIEEAEKRLGK